MIVKNAYDGNMIFYNGSINSIENSGSLLIIDTINTFVMLDSLTLNNVSTDVINVSKDKLLTSALAYSAYNLQHYEDLFLENMYDYDKQTNINKIYTYDDLELIKIYQGYDVNYSYSSSNSSVLSDFGNVLSTGEVTLTITATIGEVEKSLEVALEVIDKTNDKKMATAALDVYLNILNYYVDKESDNYVFEGPIMIPSYDSYFDVSFSYELFDSTNASLGTSGSSLYFEEQNSYYIFNPTTTIKTMKIDAFRNSSSASNTINLSGSESLKDPDNNDIINSILSDYYNGKILVTKTSDNVDPTVVDVYTITPERLWAISDFSSSAIKSVEYSLLNNATNIYEIEDVIGQDYKILKVIGNEANNNEPSVLDSVALKAVFTFESGTPTIITKTISIVYSDNQSGEESISAFRPYYVYYDRLITTNTLNYTYKDFIVPFNLNKDFPIYYFDYSLYLDEEDVTSSYPNLINIYLVDSNNNPIKDSSNNLYTCDYVKELDSELKELAKENYYWYIDIDQWGIPKIDLVLSLEYVYSLNKDNPQFQLGSPKLISNVSIPGIVRCNDDNHSTEAFYDLNLYKEIYYIYHNGETEATINEDNFIIASRLNKTLGNETYKKADSTNTCYVEGFLTFEGRTDITSYKGLDLLTSITKLNMSNSNLTCTSDSPPSVPDIDYIANMIALVELNLSSNSLSDCKPNSYGFPGSSNNFINKLSTLTNLKKLNLSNNKIYNFSGLLDLVSLEEVDIQYNTFSVSYLLLGIFEIGGVFEDIVNAIYGTSGAINKSTFMTLTSNGVAVTGYDTTAKDGEAAQIILALMNIEYQQKLPSELDVTYAYKYLSSDSADYGIPNTYTISTDGVSFSQTNFSFSFSKVGDDSFKVSAIYSYSWSYWGESGAFDIPFEVEFTVNRI